MISSRTATATGAGSPSAMTLAADRAICNRWSGGRAANVSVSPSGNQLPQACFIEDVTRGESGFAFAEALHRQRI